jgi:hypothetical protein
MKRIISVAVLSLAVLFTGCVSTKTTGVRSTSIAPGTHFNGVLVLVKYGDMEKRHHAELVLVDAFASRHIQVRSWMETFPPADSFTTEEMTAKLQALGIDTYLVLEVAGESHEAVATGTSTNCYSSYGNVNCNSHQTGRTEHGLAVEAKLFTLEGKTLWVGQSIGSGYGVGVFSSVGSDLIEHMAPEVTDQVASLYVVQATAAR